MGNGDPINQWVRPEDTLLWACDGCGVEAIRDADGGIGGPELQYRVPSNSKAHGWYASHNFWLTSPDETPAHVFSDGRKVCENCLQSCANCGRAISDTLEHDDVYAEGNSFLPEGCYGRGDAECIDCYSERCAHGNRPEENCEDCREDSESVDTDTGDVL